MRLKVQIVFDSQNPDVLSKFYAAALQYIVQPPPSGFASWEDAMKAWEVPEEDWNSSTAIVDPEGRGPRIYFQKMDTPKLGKNRMHIDINASIGSSIPIEERKKQVNLAVEYLVEIGATKQNVCDDEGEYWVVMLDPEGNEFCDQLDSQLA
jgi:hypothetical protein